MDFVIENISREYVLVIYLYGESLGGLFNACPQTDKVDQKPPAGWEAISELVVGVVAAEAGKRRELNTER